MLYLSFEVSRSVYRLDDVEQSVGTNDAARRSGVYDESNAISSSYAGVYFAAAAAVVVGRAWL